MKTQKATRYTIVWPTFEYNSQVVPASVEKITKDTIAVAKTSDS